MIIVREAPSIHHEQPEFHMHDHWRRSRLKSTSATSRPQSLFFGYNYLEANFYSIASRRGKKTTSAMARWHWLVRRPCWLTFLPDTTPMLNGFHSFISQFFLNCNYCLFYPLKMNPLSWKLAKCSSFLLQKWHRKTKKSYIRQLFIFFFLI